MKETVTHTQIMQCSLKNINANKKQGAREGQAGKTCLLAKVVPSPLLRDFNEHDKNKGKLIRPGLKVRTQRSVCGEGNTFLQALDRSCD